MPTRRQVVKAAAAWGTFAIVPRHVLGGPRFVPPSEQVNIALVGAGGQGRVNLQQLLKLPDCRVTAVADGWVPTSAAVMAVKRGSVEALKAATMSSHVWSTLVPVAAQEDRPNPP